METEHNMLEINEKDFVISDGQENITPEKIRKRAGRPQSTASSGQGEFEEGLKGLFPAVYLPLLKEGDSKCNIKLSGLCFLHTINISTDYGKMVRHCKVIL